MMGFAFASSWRSSFEGPCGGGLGSKNWLDWLTVAKPHHALLPKLSEA